MGEWIKCSERMPERFATVLIVTPDSKVAPAWRTVSRWCGYRPEHTFSLSEIDFWQPLPEPPSEPR